jgi:Tol biopolymer transport system component
MRYVLVFALVVAGTAAPERVARDLFSGEKAHVAVTDFAADGTAFVTRSSEDFSSSGVLTSGDAWRTTSTAPFSDGASDAGGTLSPDGRRLYYTSTRPGAGEGIADPWNLWVSAGEKGSWRAPSPLPRPVNTEKSECCPTAKAGGALYFSSDRDGSWDVFRAEVDAEGRVGRVEKLRGALNTEHGEWPSYVDPGERFLLLSSIRPGGHGGDDVYVSFRRGDTWSAAVNLGTPVNTAAYEDSAVLSPDGRDLYFSSRRDGGLGRPFRVPVSALSIRLK